MSQTRRLNSLPPDVLINDIMKRNGVAASLGTTSKNWSNVARSTLTQEDTEARRAILRYASGPPTQAGWSALKRAGHLDRIQTQFDGQMTHGLFESPVPFKVTFIKTYIEYIADPKNWAPSLLLLNRSHDKWLIRGSGFMARIMEAAWRNRLQMQLAIVDKQRPDALLILFFAILQSCNSGVDHWLTEDPKDPEFRSIRHKELSPFYVKSDISGVFLAALKELRDALVMLFQQKGKNKASRKMEIRELQYEVKPIKEFVDHKKYPYDALHRLKARRDELVELNAPTRWIENHTKINNLYLDVYNAWTEGGTKRVCYLGNAGSVSMWIK